MAENVANNIVQHLVKVSYPATVTDYALILLAAMRVYEILTTWVMDYNVAKKNILFTIFQMMRNMSG